MIARSTLTLAAAMIVGVAGCNRPTPNEPIPPADNGSMAAQDANAMASNDVVNGAVMNAPLGDGPVSNAAP